MSKQLVVFGLADELYGLDIFDVREVIKDAPITKIPNAPEFVEGVVNLRGKIIPVIDLKKRFGIGRGEKSKDTRIIIVDISRKEAGLIVDSVDEVITVDDNSIEPAPPVTTINAAFIEGLAKKEDKLIILIKLNLLLDAEKKEVLKNISQ